MLGAQVAKGLRGGTLGRPRRALTLEQLERQERARVLRYRARDLRDAGFSTKDADVHADNALAGFTLGLLLLRHQLSKYAPDSIDARQYRAGQRWAWVVREHARVMGYSLGGIKALSGERVSPGFSCVQEATDEQIAKVRDDWKLCYNALAEASKDYKGAPYITYAVCVENRPIAALSEADYGALRIGLNVLARVLR